MRLLALRAAQFRRFSDGVAIENISPGVNLLAGPNEMGKSTLFEALEAAFLVPHGTSGARLEDFRPRGGGEPVVEVDFETGGARWRVRKQFGRGKSAILTDLDSGRVEARAGEAEARLSELTGTGAGPGRIGLVWVRQQRALQAPDPDIDPLTGKSKTRGEANALTALLSQEVVEAAGSGLAEAIFERARAELHLLVQPNRDGPKRNGSYDLALRARDAARDGLTRAREAAAASDARLAMIAELSVRLGALEDPRATAELGQRVERLTAAVAAAQGHRERRLHAAESVKVRRMEADAARQALDKVGVAQGRARELKQALAQAQKLAAEIKVLAEAFNANTATQQRVAQLGNARALLAREQQALESMSTFVEIEPEAGGAGRIKADGVPVMQAVRASVAQSLTLEIGGVGTIRVVSSDAQRATETLRRCDEHRRTIARLLGDMGVASDAQAHAKAAEREAASARLDGLRLASIETAPKGIPALEKEFAEVSALHARSDAAGLAAALEAANAAVMAAQHTCDSLAAEGVDEGRFRDMQAGLEAARREVSRRQDDARRTSEKLERLRGEQAGIDEDGRAGEVEKMAGLLEQADGAVRRHEADIAALKLLTTTLGRAIEDVRTRYLEPVTSALLPYLKQVFPGASVAFREGFSLEALMRAGAREEFASLSDGTREQLAVLVRMGFAQLFAARDAPVPLVLDDPLVYSDDGRLDAMCAALNDAGRSYQVVLMTCRQAAFAALDAHRLSLAPWAG